jgi:uncharacterized caspase-like protein
MKQFFDVKRSFLLLLCLCVSLFCYAEIKAISRTPSDTFIFYSASQGQSASDGNGLNSVFTEAFLRHVQKNEPLVLLATDIVSDTYKMTNGSQRPTYMSQIISNKLYSIANRGSSKKHALLIGNNDYQYISKLRNPTNDVQDVSIALIQLGYEVNLIKNASLREMENAIIAFKGKLTSDKESEGFFWYAGHGVQYDNVNYLLPIDANITSGSQLRSRASSVDDIIRELESAYNKINIIVLDAARDNHFGGER